MVAAWVATVGYPQYAKAFKAMKVDGRMLPSLAMDHGQHLRTNLGVSDADAEPLSRAIIALVFGIGACTRVAPPVVCMTLSARVQHGLIPSSRVCVAWSRSAAAPASSTHWWIEGILLALLIGLGGAAFHYYQQQERVRCPLRPNTCSAARTRLSRPTSAFLFFLSSLKVLLFLFWAPQRHFIERAQMDKRISETASQVREAEALMNKLKEDAAVQRDVEVRLLR